MFSFCLSGAMAMGHAAGQCCQWLPTAAASAVEGKRVARILWTYVGLIYLVVVDVWSQAHRRLVPRTLTRQSRWGGVSRYSGRLRQFE